MSLSLMKLFPGKNQNFGSWDCYLQVPGYQDFWLIRHQINGTLLSIIRENQQDTNISLFQSSCSQHCWQLMEYWNIMGLLVNFWLIEFYRSSGAEYCSFYCNCCLIFWSSCQYYWPLMVATVRNKFFIKQVIIT
jgi:hypothetical protein